MSVATEPVFDGECCEMFNDTDAETERVYRELWARKPLKWRVEQQRRWHKTIQGIGRRAARKRGGDMSEFKVGDSVVVTATPDQLLEVYADPGLSGKLAVIVMVDNGQDPNIRLAVPDFCSRSHVRPEHIEKL